LASTSLSPSTSAARGLRRDAVLCSRARSCIAARSSSLNALAGLRVSFAAVFFSVMAPSPLDYLNEYGAHARKPAKGALLENGSIRAGSGVASVEPAAGRDLLALAGVVHEEDALLDGPVPLGRDLHVLVEAGGVHLAHLLERLVELLRCAAVAAVLE